MAYVDGFVLPVPKRKLAAYRRMAQKAGRIWREHGAHRGPALPGLAADRHGYVPIDGDCRVPGQRMSGPPATARRSRSSTARLRSPRPNVQRLRSAAAAGAKPEPRAAEPGAHRNPGERRSRPLVDRERLTARRARPPRTALAELRRSHERSADVLERLNAAGYLVKDDPRA